MGGLGGWGRGWEGWLESVVAVWEVKAGLHLDKGCVQGHPKDNRSRFIIHDCRKCFKVSQLAWRARRRTAGGSRVPGQKPHRHMLDMQTPTQKQKDPGRDWNLFAVNEHCAVVVLLIIEMWWCRHMGWTFVSKVGISIQNKNKITHNLKKHVKRQMNS